jgi:hypothetical protein
MKEWHLRSRIRPLLSIMKTPLMSEGSRPFLLNKHFLCKHAKRLTSTSPLMPAEIYSESTWVAFAIFLRGL